MRDHLLTVERYLSEYAAQAPVRQPSRPGA
jgi:hypothetical protein